MKKVIIILLSIFMLSGCEQAIETFTETVETFINYFVDIEPNKTAGTENTDFIFKANTNDIVTEWIIDGAIIPVQNIRTAESNDLIYSFSSGSHTIGVNTINGARDEVHINVLPVETIFNISSIAGENTTEIYLDYPLLKIDDIEYNIETTKELDITKTEYKNIVNLQLKIDQTDSFVFINNNAMEVYEIDLQAVTVQQLHELIIMWFPERLETPEPEIPFYSETRFNLSGNSGAVSDYLTVYDDRLNIGADDQYYADNAVYVGDIRKVTLSMSIDNSDSFLFINGNMQNFFNIDFSDMSYSELVVAADILNRYPEDGILQLMEIY